MVKLKCDYHVYEYSDHLLKQISFFNKEQENITYQQKIYEYIQITLESDLYLKKDIDEFFSLIPQSRLPPPNEYF